MRKKTFIYLLLILPAMIAQAEVCSKTCITLKGNVKFEYSWNKASWVPACTSNPHGVTTVTERFYMKRADGTWKQMSRATVISVDDMIC